MLIRLIGGQWLLPTNRPISLRPMFKREEYKQFANDVNKAMNIRWFSWDNLFISILFVIAPPLCNWILVSSYVELCNVITQVIFDYFE